MRKIYIKENKFNEIIENINKRLETLETNNEETRNKINILQI